MQIWILITESFLFLVSDLLEHFWFVEELVFCIVVAKVKTIDNHVTTITSHIISVTELIATNEGLVSQLSEALGR